MFESFSTFWSKACPVALGPVNSQVFLELTLEVKALSAVVAFIHVFVVMIPMFYHCCQCVKCSLTNIALHWEMGGPEMLIYFRLAAKVLTTLLAQEFSFGVDIFSFQFIFYRHECFLFLFSWLVISWLNCFLLHLNHCTNYFGFCLVYISWLWWRS